MNDTLRGALKSKVLWFNFVGAIVAAVELSGAHLTTLFGTKGAAGVLLAGCIINAGLRFITANALADKP